MGYLTDEEHPMSDEHTTEKDSPQECPRCQADSDDIGRERAGAWSCGECGLIWSPASFRPEGATTMSERAGILAALSQRRRALALKQSDVAEMIGVSQQEVSKWERGLYAPRLSNLERYAAVLGARLGLVIEQQEHARSTSQSPEVNDSARLSRMLFEARERVEMAADIVEAQMGMQDTHGRRLVAEIDAYRAERGWSPHGFGGEQ